MAAASPGFRPVPFFVGRYRCEEYLGGGMADVYRARDTELGRDVAIKILKPENEGDEEARRSFVDEAQLASQCCHDNIVTTYDKGEFHGAPFIVMEFLRGRHLGDVIAMDSVRDPERNLRIALQIAKAVAYVHSQNIVHRDLKPQNLHMDATGRVKLVDFGIAKAVDWNKTQAGWAKGTAPYMAPEQVRAEPVSFRTDVWAFGVVLYELLTGVKPFQGANFEQLFAAILNSNPDYELLNKHAIPEAARRMVRLCLEKRPERRNADFSSIAAELEQILGSFRPHAPQPEVHISTSPKLAQIWSNLNWRTRSIATVAALCILAFACWLVFRILAGHALPKELALPSGNMLLVDAGPALVGGDRHRVDVPAFYMDKTEVSNRAYAEFLRKTAHRKPPGFPEDKPDYPVVNVTFYDALAFAKWAGKRLPTEVEWEKAARGKDGLLFPWGNSSDRHLANLADNPDLRQHTLMTVSSLTRGASPFGILNMIGNVWEWVDADQIPEPGYFAGMQNTLKPVPPLSDGEPFYEIRGGYYENPLSSSLTSEPAPFPARLGAKNIGFRCAKTPVRE